MDLEGVGAILEFVGLAYTVAGSLPGLRIGTKPAPIRSATGAPKMNLRLSMPTTSSIP